MHNHERTLIVLNPAATGAGRVERDVINPLLDNGIPHGTIVTPSPEYKDNVEAIGGFIRDGDLLVIAAGDGTVAQVTEAIVRSQSKDVKVAALPLGGFVDLAQKKAGILDIVGPGADIEEYRRYLLSVHFDNETEPWRYANAYLGIGRLALIASSFGTTESRDRLRGRTGPTKRALQLAQLGIEYFKLDFFLPEHSTNQSGLVQRAVTDYMFVNNNRAGGIMGFPVDFGQTDRFGVVQRDISKIARNIPFGVMALANRAPSDVHYQYDIWLEEAASMPVHNDGEFAQVETNRISVRKDPAASYTAVRPRRN